MSTVNYRAAKTKNARKPSACIAFLDVSSGRIVRANPDGTEPKTIIKGCRMPDGIAIDAFAGHVYWTEMGRLKENDGSIERADLDGRNRMVIVPKGGTFTPKQLQLDLPNSKIYWCDREGMRVMRANLDGSQIETLIEAGRGESARLDARNWCVGIAIDKETGKLYWSQKGADNAGEGRILRANIELHRGESADNRSDIEVLFEGLPEPVDLEIDHANRMLYWTDRGDPPRGNTVSRAPIDTYGAERNAPEIVFNHLMEGIGLALDPKGGRLFATDLAGSVYCANLDGSERRTLLAAQGNVTGIAYADFA